MTLIELKQRVDHVLSMSPRNEDLIVCIPNGKGGQGGISCTTIVNAHKGSDWNSGKFMLKAEVDMVNDSKEIEPHKIYKGGINPKRDRQQ